MSDTKTARMRTALAHLTHLRIVRQLAERNASCYKDRVATLDLVQSTVSHHLKILIGAGFVPYRQSGQRSRDSINSDAFADGTALVGDRADRRCPLDTIVPSARIAAAAIKE